MNECVKSFIYSRIKFHNNSLKWKTKTVLKRIKSKSKKTWFKIQNLKSTIYFVIISKNKTKSKPSTSHSNWPRLLFFDLAYKQCNGNIKGWLHCLTSESKGRFLVNNILLGSACSLVMAQIQLRNKDWTSRTLTNPSPPTSNNMSFLPYLFTPHPPPHPHKHTHTAVKVDVILLTLKLHVREPDIHINTEICLYI